MFVSTSRCEGGVIGSDTGMAGFLFNDEILEDPVGPARARRKSVFRPQVNLGWPVPELFRQAMCHVHVLDPTKPMHETELGPYVKIPN